ncbi:HAMP domain-containing sensor histidine kinase [Chryseolinea sp. H1M3-3]|uniref:sensor histidine kinase n=1 Tax=Chryseolinea sp. H1M3-3 TaxID=3034144 RepID=UPI0023EDE407|nr:HAMP domain-containing sensor histidine kinase [Chryseolinea sp. H1M3-3]
MRNPLKRITAIFIVVAILPIGFILHELNTLSENEKIVKEIYQNQLDAILYSINQYSDDVINSWANRFNIALIEEKYSGDSTRQITSVLNQIVAVQHIYFNDLNGASIVYNAEGIKAPDAQIRLDNVVKQNRDRIDRLITYKRAGFRKMELMDTINTDRPVPVFFVLDSGSTTYRLGAMVIDLPVFIESTLGPKMQAIAQDKFIITAFRTDTDSLIFSTVSADETAALPANDQSQKKSFWLLPGYYVSIALPGATINDLVRERMITSLVILGLLIAILGLGIWFLYKNIRREMYLAQAKSEFVSNVSHEIRTPLSLISMYAETLEMNRVSEEKKKEYHTVIAKEAARLSGIVNRILNFSQIQANKKQYESKPIQLNDLVDEVLKSYFFHLKDKGFTCKLDKDETLEMIRGDRESIAEAFINLIDNAMKYSRDKKNILIATGRDGKFNFIEVKDEGIGILKKHQEEIFDQFYRAPTGDVHDTKGSGLGLTLVRKTMDAHRGKVKVDSIPGRGSTFRLYFPIKKDIAP